MQVNFQYAIGIIAALSLLLGLSIGQLHEQYRNLQNAKQDLTLYKSAVNPQPATTADHKEVHCSHEVFNCLDKKLRNKDLQVWISGHSGIRIKCDKIRLREVEEIKAALRESAIKEVRRDKTHVILQEEL